MSAFNIVSARLSASASRRFANTYVPTNKRKVPHDLDVPLRTDLADVQQIELTTALNNQTKFMQHTVEAVLCPNASVSESASCAQSASIVVDTEDSSFVPKKVPSPRDLKDPLFTVELGPTVGTTVSQSPPLDPFDPLGEHPQFVAVQSSWLPSRVVPDDALFTLVNNGAPVCSRSDNPDPADAYDIFLDASCAPTSPATKEVSHQKKSASSASSATSATNKDIYPEEVPMELRPDAIIPGNRDIPDRCAEVKDILLTTQWNSYNQGCGCLLDRKNSGQRRKILYCSTKHEAIIDDKPKIVDCPYRAIWRFHVNKGLGTWDLDRKNSILVHAIGCQSKRRLTSDMLVHQKEFVSKIASRKTVTIKHLYNAALTEGVSKASVSARTLYRAKHELLCQMASDYDNHFDHMHTWAQNYCAKNPGSHWDVQRDEEGRFKRVFLSFGSARDLAMQTGIGFSMVDGTHMHHVHYRDGVAHMCTTLDGNNRTILLAAAICETESASTWAYFGEKCLQAGLGKYLDQALSVVMHDRMKGIQRFMEFFPKAKDLECWRHIIDNIYRHLGGTKGLGVKLLWAIRKAETFHEWEKHFNVVADISAKAADYISNNINGQRNFKYKILEEGIRSHNRTTSQASEGQSFFRRLRHFRHFRHFPQN